jgi:hypothetical protein
VGVQNLIGERRLVAADGAAFDQLGFAVAV